MILVNPKTGLSRWTQPSSPRHTTPQHISEQTASSSSSYVSLHGTLFSPTSTHLGTSLHQRRRTIFEPPLHRHLRRSGDPLTEVSPTPNPVNSMNLPHFRTIPLPRLFPHLGYPLSLLSQDLLAQYLLPNNAQTHPHSSRFILILSSSFPSQTSPDKRRPPAPSISRPVRGDVKRPNLPTQINSTTTPTLRYPYRTITFFPVVYRYNPQRQSQQATRLPYGMPRCQYSRESKGMAITNQWNAALIPPNRHRHASTDIPCIPPRN